jgi:hypothetical protein
MKQMKILMTLLFGLAFICMAVVAENLILASISAFLAVVILLSAGIAIGEENE